MFLKLTELFKTAIVKNFSEQLFMKRFVWVISNSASYMVQIVTKVRQRICRKSTDNFDFLEQIYLKRVFRVQYKKMNITIKLSIFELV